VIEVFTLVMIMAAAVAPFLLSFRRRLSCQYTPAVVLGGESDDPDFVVSAATDDGGDWSLSGGRGGTDEPMDDANPFVMDQGEDARENRRSGNRKKNVKRS
jgi:hypothetical protein